MSNFIPVRGKSADITNTGRNPIASGKISFTTDSGKLYLDFDDNGTPTRIPISDIINLDLEYSGSEVPSNYNYLSHKVYIHDGKLKIYNGNELIPLVQDSKVNEGFTVTKSVGGLSVGATIANDERIESILKRILSPAVYATINNITINKSPTSASNVYEIGSEVIVTLSNIKINVGDNCSNIKYKFHDDDYIQAVISNPPNVGGSYDISLNSTKRITSTTTLNISINDIRNNEDHISSLNYTITFNNPVYCGLVSSNLVFTDSSASTIRDALIDILYSDNYELDNTIAGFDKKLNSTLKFEYAPNGIENKHVVFLSPSELDLTKLKSGANINNLLSASNNFVKATDTILIKKLNSNEYNNYYLYISKDPINLSGTYYYRYNY